MAEPHKDISQPVSQSQVEQAIEQDPSRALDFVTNVGRLKPLGSVSDIDIVNHYKGGLPDFERDIQAKGLKVRVFPTPLLTFTPDQIPGNVEQFVEEQERSDFKIAAVPNRGSGERPVFVWDEGELKKLLEENKPILEKAGWPTDPDKFVTAVAIATPGFTTQVHGVIAKAFGDEEELELKRQYEEFLRENNLPNSNSSLETFQKKFFEGN